MQACSSTPSYMLSSIHLADFSATLSLAGPSDAARALGLAKRKRMLGTALTGRAAQLVRRAQVSGRSDGATPDVVNELVQGVGQAGQIFYVQRAAKVGRPAPPPPPPQLLHDELTVVVVRGQVEACARVLEYHTHMCNGAPGSMVGRDAALARGWTGVQQAFAIAGFHAPGSRGTPKVCNLVVCVEKGGFMVGVLAISLHSGLRMATVQAIHVVPAMRGPYELPPKMWRAGCEWVASMARASAVSVRKVRFSLELPCCQSQQGAYFWIVRMGWTGNDAAKRAANEWGLGNRMWSVGSYVLTYTLDVK